MLPLPRMSFTGIADYLLLAVGISIGLAIFNAPMNQLETAFRRN